MAHNRVITKLTWQAHRKIHKRFQAKFVVEIKESGKIKKKS